VTEVREHLKAARWYRLAWRFVVMGVLINVLGKLDWRWPGVPVALLLISFTLVSVTDA
jgi:hypothetical protein